MRSVPDRSERTTVRVLGRRTVVRLERISSSSDHHFLKGPLIIH